MSGMRLLDIKPIRGRDVTFLTNNEWVCAYVRLEGNLNEDVYGSETFREGNIIGIDTAHYWNDGKSIKEHQEDADQQITEIIEQWETQQ